MVSHDILRLAIDSQRHVAFITLDRDGVITSWSHGAHRLLGYAREHAEGRLIATVVGSALSPGIGRADLYEAETVDVASTSRWLTHADGTRKRVQLSVSVLRENGRVVGFSAIAYEIPAPADATRRQLSDTNALLAVEVADRAQVEASRSRLLRRLIVAQEEERRRIARDLHDDLGQRLTSLRLTLEALANTPRVEGCDAGTVATALETVTEIDQALDFIAWELRPAALDDVGLSRVLHRYVAEWSRHSGVRAVFHSRPDCLDRVAPEVEASLYRIAQEALNNVAKHASARSVNVLLELRGPNIALVVEDDGVGFHRVGVDETMIGLMGMRERALALGGTLEIEPTPEGGTTLVACIPTSGVRRPEPPMSRTDGEIHHGAMEVPERLVEWNEPNGSALSTIRLRLQELQRAVGARDEFIATVAHELRNPIAPLVFQVRLALNKTEQMAAANSPVAIAWIQSQFRGFEQRLHRVMQTLDRLLDVSRLSTGRIDLQVESMDLAVIVHDIIHTLDAELTVARSSVSVSVQGETTGLWDALRVEQICRNLISNAIRFGAGRPIEVSLRGDDDFAIVQVRDHGVGIARDQHSKIFERFERGLEQRSGGFGVGLWIVRNLCAAMGGTVSVESELGEGACFTVMLPRRGVRSAAPGTSASE